MGRKLPENQFSLTRVALSTCAAQKQLPISTTFKSTLGLECSVLFFILVHLAFTLSALAQGSSFTYQGKLSSGTDAASGNYDLKFSLHDALTNGNVIGGPLTNGSITLTDGLFTVILDFGSVFDGNARWVEIGVRTNGSGAFTTLFPRQPILPVPYTIMANTASNLLGTLSTAQLIGSVPVSQLSGTVPIAQLPPMLLTNNETGVSLNGILSGNGAGLAAVNLATANSLGAINWTTNFPGFNFVSSPVVGTGPRSVTTMDVNNDGKMDVICANVGDNTLMVLTNNGSGNLVLQSTYPLPNGPASVIAVDVNRDGYLDLVTAGGDSMTVLTNDHSGYFKPASTNAIGNGAQQVIAADVNADGAVDLITADRTSSRLTVLTNDGEGHFTISATPSVPYGPVSVVAADVNGDGYVDLVSAVLDLGTLCIQTNNGLGGFLLASTLSGTTGNWVTAADVNGDGKVDLIAANSGGASLTIYTNDGAGNFAIASTPHVGAGPVSVAAVDVNLDGKVDLISVNFGNPPSASTLTVLTNDGVGNFATAASPGVGVGPGAVAAADINGDGKIDLISANSGNYYSGNTLTVLTNALSVDASFVGNGSGLTSLTASNLTGTIADARLSTNVALLDASQTFTGTNTFKGTTVLSNQANAFTGSFTGNGGGLTNLQANAVTGGLTTNVAVLLPNGRRSTLCFTNGILKAIQ